MTKQYFFSPSQKKRWNKACNQSQCYTSIAACCNALLSSHRTRRHLAPQGVYSGYLWTNWHQFNDRRVYEGPSHGSNITTTHTTPHLIECHSFSSFQSYIIFLLPLVQTLLCIWSWQIKELCGSSVVQIKASCSELVATSHVITSG